MLEKSNEEVVYLGKAWQSIIHDGIQASETVGRTYYHVRS